MSVLVAAVIAATAIAGTYLCCLRPMARSRRQCGPSAGSGPDAEVDRQVAALREELRILRAEDSLSASRPPA